MSGKSPSPNLKKCFMICVSIGNAAQLQNVLRLRAEMLELRLDLIREEPEKLFAWIPGDIRVIATCRPGGPGDGERMDLLKAAVELGAGFLDLEIESSPEYFRELAGYAVERGCRVIVSYHNSEQTPGRDRLTAIMDKAYQMGASVAKIATEVHTVEDIRNLFSLYDLPGRKVVIGMGEKGRITRVAAPYLGAEFTFAAPDDGPETAPGQLTYRRLKEIYEIIEPL